MSPGSHRSLYRDGASKGDLLLVIGGRLDRDDIPGLCARAGLLLRDGAEILVCDVGGLQAPDVVAVDALARLRLVARAEGRRFRIENAPDELWELIDLMGLVDAMSCGSD